VDSDQQPEVYDFPAIIPIVVIGKNEDDFEGLVVEIILREIHPSQLRGVERKPSSGDKYLSVSVTLEVESRDQLNTLYGALRADARVRMII